MSVLLIAAAPTRMRSSPGAGTGSGTFSRYSSRSGPPNPVSRTARIVTPLPWVYRPVWLLSRAFPLSDVNPPVGILAAMTQAPDTLTPAGRRVLDVAGTLFCQQGIHAVGVEAIAAAAGVTKKTLYACFGSKDQLVTAYLAERDQRWKEWLTGWVDERAHAPWEKLLGVFDALEAWMAAEDFRGCGFVNALAELPAAEHPARQVIAGQKRWMRGHQRGFRWPLRP